MVNVKLIRVTNMFINMLLTYSYYMSLAVDDECRFGLHLRRRASDSSKTRVVEELNKLSGYFIVLYQTQRMRPLS